MALELNINGTFDMTILDYHSEAPLEKDIEQGVIDNLLQGEYLISIDSKTIVDINDPIEPLYKFSLFPQPNTEYEFEEK